MVFCNLRLLAFAHHHLFFDVASLAEDDFVEVGFKEPRSVAAELYYAGRHGECRYLDAACRGEGHDPYRKQVHRKRQQEPLTHEYRKQNQCRGAEHGHGRQPVHEFQRTGIEQVKVMRDIPNT